MTPTESDMQLARDIANTEQIKIISASLLSVEEIASIISQHLASERAGIVELERKAKALDWLEANAHHCRMFLYWPDGSKIEDQKHLPIIIAHSKDELFLTAIEAAMGKEKP